MGLKFFVVCEVQCQDGVNHDRRRQEMKVLELRKFLKSRNVTCGEATKAQLLELSLLTIELDVRAIADDDFEKSLGERRTVAEGGRQVVLPDPNVIAQWENNLKVMPKIDIADVFVFDG